MKIFLELNTDGTKPKLDWEEKDIAQELANKLQVTVQLNNGNYGSVMFEPKEEQ